MHSRTIKFVCLNGHERIVCSTNNLLLVLFFFRAFLVQMCTAISQIERIHRSTSSSRLVAQQSDDEHPPRPLTLTFRFIRKRRQTLWPDTKSSYSRVTATPSTSKWTLPNNRRRSKPCWKVNRSFDGTNEQHSCVDLGMDEEEDVIPLPNVNSAILKKVSRTRASRSRQTTLSSR